MDVKQIVVDNSPIGKTKEVAYKYTDKGYNFGPERLAQRNCGANKPKGKYILHLDADMNLSEKVIEGLEEQENRMQHEFFDYKEED